MKRTTHIGKRLRNACLASASLLVGSVLTIPLSAARPELGTTKVLVGAEDRTAQDRLLAQGGRLIAERGSFHVFEVPEAVTLSASLGQGVTVRDDFNYIMMNRMHVDTRLAEPQPSGLYATTKANKGLKLVQFDAPPEQQDLDKLTAMGVKIVHAVPQNAYIVWVADSKMEALLKEAPALNNSRLQYVSNYLPEFAIQPDIDAMMDGVDAKPVTIQLYIYEGNFGENSFESDLKSIWSNSSKIVDPGQEVLEGLYYNIRVEATPEQIREFSKLPSVVTVEPYIEPKLMCERQALIMSHQWDVPGTGPLLGTGYLARLTAWGFPTTPASYPNICVVDDGLDNGNAAAPAVSEFREQNVAGNPSRIVFSAMPAGVAGTPNGTGGHGHINTSIVGGYNSGTGAANEETPEGFNYGLGVSPHGRVSHIKVFSPGFNPGTSDTTMVNAYYASGADVSTNSWGASVGGAYDTSSQTYDSLTRDSSTALAGRNEMLFLFAAGNDGNGANTIGSPGTAKNVLTVGAEENNNQPDAGAGDGCGETSADGDNLLDMATFSSRGPCDDARIKPEIVAPGTFVYGSHPASGFTGGSVCGGPATNEFPVGSAYTWSSGTSHSTPGVAGYVSLIGNFLNRIYGFNTLPAGHNLADKNGLNPSAALLKAYVIHSGTYLSGTGAGGNLPTNSQGFGLSDMGIGFNTTAPRFFNNQDTVLTNVGDIYSISGNVATNGQPVRVALVWTDPPGPTAGNAFINNLDLEVIVNGVTYDGNVFTNGVSTPGGGTANIRDNSEAVFLAAGATGSMTVRVIATGLAGDGAPGTGDATDQNFALVVYNITFDRLSISPGTPLNASGFYGGPFTPSSQLFTLTNTGSGGGAQFNWTASDNQTWLNTSSPSSGTLAGGASTNVTISLNSGVNTLSPGVHTGVATFTNTTSGFVQTRNVNLTIGDSLSVTPSTTFLATGFSGGPVTPECRTYTLTNNTTASLNWSATPPQNWLTCTPPSGTLAAGASTTVDVCITDAANCLAAGPQAGAATFSDLTNGFDYPRFVTLTMSSARDCNANGVSDAVDIAPIVTVAQDNCSSALYATTGVTYTGTTVGATDDGTATCGASSSTVDKWLRYRPTANGTLTVSTCGAGTNYDTVLALFTGACPGTTEVACNDDNTAACGAASTKSQISASVVSGTDYLIRISGWNGSTGAFQVVLTGPTGFQPGPVSADANSNGIPDECEAAADLDGDGKPNICEKTATGDLVGGFYTNGMLKDSDGDGLTDGQEKPCDCYSIVTVLAQSNPRRWDTDNDGWGDGLEQKNPGTFPNGPLVADAAFADSDNDGLPNTLDPNDASADADGDLYSDVYESVQGTNIMSAASKPGTGNVNNSGGVDVADVSMSSDANLGLVTMTAPWNSDINLDGIIDLSDVAALADLNLAIIICGPI